MNAKPKLKLAESKSAYEKAMDRIDKDWGEWRGPTGRPWQAYDGPTSPWSEKVSSALDRGRYVVQTEESVPLWRRIIKWLRLR